MTKPPLSLTPTATTLATLAEPLRSAPSAAEACTQLLADAQVARVALPQAALESLLTHLSNSSRWDDAVAFVRVALRREGPVVLPCLQHLAGLMQRAAAAHDRSGAPPSGHGLQNAYRQVRDRELSNGLLCDCSALSHVLFVAWRPGSAQLLVEAPACTRRVADRCAVAAQVLAMYRSATS